jgi:hypothetical protein
MANKGVCQMSNTFALGNSISLFITFRLLSVTCLMPFLGSLSIIYCMRGV